MKTRNGSQGGKVVTCVRCSGDIQPYAGREVADNRYAHHPGQCSDVAARDAATRQLAGQGALFAWRCDHIEPGAALGPRICSELGTDKAAYAAHMKAHGMTPLTSAAGPVKLRKRPPAAPRVAPLVPAFKQLHWHEVKYGEWQAGIGNPVIGECERRGQYWANAGPNSVWVIPLERAPWESTSRPPAPVELYLTGIPGRYTTDWSAAKRDRREAKRRGQLAA
jgi:hypothetical protein